LVGSVMSRGLIVLLVVCGVITAIVIAVIITVVVLVVQALKDKVSFETFSSEVRVDYGRGHVTNEKQFAFDMSTWYTEQYVDGEFYSRIYRDDEDYAVVCNKVGDHDSCYSLSGNYIIMYTISAGYSKEKSEVKCPSIHAPALSGGSKRELNTCDMYMIEGRDASNTNRRIKKQEWVESDNLYPVMSITTTYEGLSLVSNVTQEYTLFDPKKPEDKTGLHPPEGAKVYDFRTGKTSPSIIDGVSDLVGWIVSFFKGSEPPKNVAAEAMRKRFEQTKLLNNRLQVSSLFPVVAGPAIGKTPKSVKERDDTPIPESFDARTKWDRCSDVIGHITNQKDCGSCWAMATAAVISDRACIKGLSQTQYSPQFMVSCYLNQAGCQGGFGATVWNDVSDIGTVPESCYPFVAKDEACPSKCANGTAITPEMYIKVPKFYSPWADTDEARVKAIQREIMENGPVATSMLVFSGFSSIHRSVYKREKNEKYGGGHMVRIIGWGTEGGEDYWLVANSWGDDWNEKGLFKIRRGTNEVNIENTITAGLFA